MLQGNIPQQLKWSPSFLKQTDERYDSLTKENWHSNLIIWPEAALPLPHSQATEYLDDLAVNAKQHDTTIVLGIPFRAENSNQFYNAIIAIGANQGRYNKYHLVPFGEFLPLSNLLSGIIEFFNLPMSDFLPGAAQQSNLKIGAYQIAPFICYEIAYPDGLRRSLPAAGLLLTVSNDAWFGDSLAPWQHAQIGQMRALQTGRYHLMNGNNGITAVFDNNGNVVARIPQFKTATLTTTVQLRTGATPWVIWGNIPIYLICFLILIGGFFRTLQTRKHMPTASSTGRDMGSSLEM